MTIRTFTATTAGGTPPFSYAWEGSTDYGDTWTPLGAAKQQQANDAVFTHVRVTASNAGGSAISGAFDLSQDAPTFSEAPVGGAAPHAFEWEHTGTTPVTATLHLDTGDDVGVDEEDGYADDDTEIALDDAVEPGDLLESAGGEFMRVTAYADGVATVERGFGGTTPGALAHEAQLRTWSLEESETGATDFDAVDPASETDYVVGLRNLYGSAISSKLTVTVEEPPLED